MKYSLDSRNKTNIAKSKFLSLKKDLKLMILLYLPIEDSFHSLVTCNSTFKNLIQTLNIFPLITSGLTKRTLKKETLTIEFKQEIISNWDKYFEDMEQRDKFVSRILKK